MESQIQTSVTYLADLRGSQFTLQVFSGGMFSAFGHSPTIAIRDFSGEAKVDPDDPAHSSLKIVVKAESLAVKDDISEKDRREIERMMQQDVLETASYPEIIYECSALSAAKTGEGQYAMTLNGDLTMHGETHPQSVPARIALAGNTLRAFGNFSLRQSDYGLKLASVAGGALKVKDELKFSFNILARKKE